MIDILRFSQDFLIKINLQVNFLSKSNPFLSLLQRPPVKSAAMEIRRLTPSDAPAYCIQRLRAIQVNHPFFDKNHMALPL